MGRNRYKERAKGVKGHYIIDNEALNIIEKTNIKTIITNPEVFTDFDYSTSYFGLGGEENYSEVIV